MIAVIPARGGSKRVPRKNVRDFHGRPMIAWAIQHAIQADVFDRVVVSTDDDEIAAAAEAAGADVPFRRPAALADDHTATIPVIAHAIEALGSPCDDATAVCCIYPATPLVEPAQLRAAVERWRLDPTRFVLAAYAPDLPIARAFTLDEDGAARMLLPGFTATRTQDLPRTLLDAGCFYVGSTRAWTTAESVIEGARVVEIPADRAIDIDTEADWQRALAVFTRADGPIGGTIDG
jgi:N-acylneuraminate cytidylyltransferase